MDVTCERCGTEYEFDETLLSGRGTSVKCTNCGHVFKVFPTASAEAEQPSNSWRLKLEDGSIDEIDSLRELQRRISSGELTPENAIARGDDEWKTLGSIPELETFFHAAGVQIPSGRIPSPLPPVIRPSGSRESSIPPGRRPRQPTLLGVMPVQRTNPEDGATGAVTASVAEPVAAAESASTTAAGSAAGPVSAGESAAALRTESVDESVEGDEAGEPSYRSSYISEPAPEPSRSSPPPRGEIEDAEFEEDPPPASRSPIRTSTPPPAYYDDDDDIPSLPSRGGSPLRWLLLIVAVGGLALVIAQWPRIADMLGVGDDPALIAAGVSEGDAAIAEGHAEAYASAIEAYGRAIEWGANHDAEIMAKLSNAYALAAQAQIDNGADEDRIAPLTDGALTTAATAIELDPDNLDVRLAEADALRLAGQSSDAREVLESARSMSFSRTAEFFRVDARLRAAEADGDLQAGLRSATQAAELAPQGVPYLLLLARSERAAGNAESARVPLDTILSDHPDHPVARRLLAELDAAKAAEVLTDEGVAVDAGVPADAAAEEAVEPEEAPSVAATEEKVAAAAAETKPQAPAENAQPSKTAPPRKAVRKPRPAKPAYDEYDRLAQAAGDDAFVDGRPPVRDYEWYMREGRTELAGGNYARARAFFDSALEARPGSADAMDGLAKVSIGIEDFDSAIRYFRVAAQRGNPDGYFNLGKTYERMGRNDEAVSAYYTYMKRRPSGPHAAAARAAIKTLEPNAKLPPAPESEPKSEPGLLPAEEPAQDPESTTP